MSNITLRQLRYFDALAEHGHFGRAADACAVSQPALSVQIKELEDALGCILCERMPRQVRLTTLGREFLKRTRDILRAVDELEDVSRAAQDHWVGELRIGVIPTIAPYLLPRIVQQLTDAFPGAQIHMRETMTSNLIRELVDGRIDTAILALPISDPALTEVPLFDEEFVLVRPLADKDKPVPNREGLREMRLLLLEEGHCFRDQALSFCDMHNTNPRETLDGSALTTLVQMVGAGMGVTLIPDMAVGVETGSAPVTVSRFDAPKPSRTIGMVWRASSPLAQQFYRMADCVKQAAKTSGSGTEEVV